MQAYNLSELTSIVAGTLSAHLDSSYWVRAEIASLSVSNGHAYFDLVEKADSGLLSAKMRATCWSSLYPMIAAYFQSETGTKLQVGMNILIEVEVQFHDVYGLSANIINIDPQYSLGELARSRQVTIARLHEEGIFDLQKSLVLPSLVRRLAVVSSHQAAGYEDFIHQLESSPFAFAHTLFPATMQGEQAEASLIRAIDTVFEEADHFDAMVIIRGGGASTDLTCFDAYELCARCAQFPLPILTGIGHTRDVSVLDMVVHTPLKTPTAVAAFLIDRLTEQQEQLTYLRQRLQHTAERQITLRRHRLEMLAQAIKMYNPEQIYRKGYSLLTASGKTIRSIQDIQPGMTLTTHLQDGSIHSVAQ